MKKIFIALFLILSLSLAASQYWVVGEVFTQIGWGYCASARAGLADLEEYEDAPYFIPIMWQGNGEHQSPQYSQRANMYGVSGIPHSQWGGIYDIVGGGGTTMFAQYRSRYNAMVNWESPLEIEMVLDPAYETATAYITVTGEITTTNNKVIFVLTNRQNDDYFCSAITYEALDFDLTAIGESETFIHNINTGDYNIDDITVNVFVQTLSPDYRILQASRVIVADEQVPLHVDALDFGSAAIGETVSINLPIYNYGDTELTGMLFPPAGFSSEAEFTVPPHTIMEAEITFAPQEEMVYSDMMIVTTSHADYPTFFVNLTGEGLPNNDSDHDQIVTSNSISNYPNPFNPETTIRYSLHNAGMTCLDIYNIKGELVTNLVNTYQDAGNYKYNWIANDLAAGVYLARLKSGNHISEQKLILLK